MKKIILPIFVLLAISLSLNGQEKRLALVIGNASYTYTTSLANPVNDAVAVSLMLEQLGFDVLKYENLSLIEMKRAIDDFGDKLKKYELGLFYYAGHGVQVNGNNYLLPVDAELKTERDAEYDCINAGRILAKFEDSRVKTNIIILDACRNNPFLTTWSRGVKKNGLAYMEAPAGFLIAFSTSPDNTASDGTGTNSLYTESLLQCIGDPQLNIIQIFQKVRKMVRENSSGEQIPWEWTSMEGDFYFNQTGKEVITANTLNNDPKPEIRTREIMNRVAGLKSNASLVWAEGKGKTPFEADMASKQQMNRIICNTLYGYTCENNDMIFLNPDAEYSKKGLELIIEELQPFISRNIYTKGRRNYVTRFLPKSDIENILNIKRGKIFSMYDMAYSAENDYEIGDALKYYFWAYSLTKFHPQSSGIMISDGLNALNFFEGKIEHLLKNISCKIVDTTFYEGYKRAEIKFFFKDKIIKNIDFRFWNGVTWSEDNCVNNGIGFIDLYPETRVSDLKLEVIYQNNNKTKFDKTIMNALQNPDLSKFMRSCAITEDYRKPEKSVPKVPDYYEYYNSLREVISYVQKKIHISMKNFLPVTVLKYTKPFFFKEMQLF